MNNDYLNYISHHGILGQRWGIRRYQYKDGSLTSEGKIRYGSGNDIKYKLPHYESYAMFVAKNAAKTIPTNIVYSLIPGLSLISVANEVNKQGGLRKGRTEKYVEKDGEFESVKKNKNKEAKRIARRLHKEC